jgi:hypothetical protein
VIVNGAVPVPVDIGVIGDAMNRLTPAGGVPIQDADNAMAELNPFMETTVTVAEPLPPCVNMILEVDVREKSGKAAVELVLFDVVDGTLTEKVAGTDSPLGIPIAVTV